MSTANGPDSSTLGHVLWNWISDSTVSRSDDYATQIQCYAFPYGALGFIAHLAMFYGIVLSSFNTCPYNYRRPLKHSTRDLALGIISLGISIDFTTVTMYRCSGAKYYMLIAFSKILATGASSCIGIHIAWDIQGRKKFGDGDDKSQLKTTFHSALRWFTLEFFGSILEIIGVIMLLKEKHDAVARNRTSIMVITLCLAGFTGISLGIGITWLEVRQREQRRMKWEVQKAEGKCAALKERLGSERRPRRAPNRRRGAPNPVNREQDIEAQRLISPANKDEPGKEPIFCHYQDILNSVKQFVLVTGATFGVSMTLYTDWILAAVSGSYWGFPATGNTGITVVYLIFYFVVRIMPVLSA